MRAQLTLATVLCAAAAFLSTFSTGAASADDRGAPVLVAHSSDPVNRAPSGAEGLCGTSEGAWTDDGITSQYGGPSNPSLVTWGAKKVRCYPGTTVRSII